ncbi:MAG: FkbM family methyltransferase [Mycoplasma sp.]|nr:FkbM family methyltransferase [Mycoplasma sp.]
MSKKIKLEKHNITLILPDHGLVSEIKKEKDFWEIELLKKLDELLINNQPNVIVDIGSNIGNHLVYWKMKYHNANFLAYEPVSYPYKLILENLSENNMNKKTDQIINAGIFNKNTNMEIMVNEKSLSVSSITNKWKIKNGTKENIKLLDIKEEEKKWSLNKMNNVLIKMDIEGAEQLIWDEIFDVLKAASANVFFMVEISISRINKINKVISQMKEINYELVYINLHDFIFTNAKNIEDRIVKLNKWTAFKTQMIMTKNVLKRWIIRYLIVKPLEFLHLKDFVQRRLEK